MLDLPRLKRLGLVRRPVSQRFFGRLLHINYNFLPGVELSLENWDLIPDTPVIFAMNHTDRYNYFPFQYSLWREFDRFTTTWVKGKYYENALMAQFMESMLQLPTVSRGYLITKDFQSVLGRTPTDQEYALLRGFVDARAIGDPGVAPSPPEIPEMLFRKARNPLGVRYEPAEADYADYICQLFQEMMGEFVARNREAAEIGLDLLVFPQGTRSKRLLPSHIGIAQIALYLKIPIVPVGCSGSDGVYPGASPFGKKGRVAYRVGEPITYEDLKPYHISEEHLPFSATSEREHADAFRAVADLVTDRIDPLLDKEYRRAPEEAVVDREIRSSDRFV